MLSTYDTDRITLSLATVEDSPFLMELMNSPSWIRFIGDKKVETIEKTRQYIQRISNDPLYHYWIITSIEQQAPVGIVTLIKRDYLEHWDIGFALLDRYRGMGFASDAATLIIQAVRKSGTHSKLLATTVPENVSSVRLLTKLGFACAGSISPGGLELMFYAMDLLD